MALLLLADGDSAERERLRALLDGTDHLLLEAGSLAAARALLAEAAPELALLDARLADGAPQKACQALRDARPEHPPPVVLLHAGPPPPDHGADELLARPVERAQLLARIASQLERARLGRELARTREELERLTQLGDEQAHRLVHDLKSPVAVVLTNLEYLERLVRDAELSDALSDALTAGRRILRLLSTLVDVPRLERGHPPLKLARVPLQPLFEPLLAERRRAAQMTGAALEATLDATVEVAVETDLFGRLVEHLLDHAVQHAPRGGRILVELSADGPRVRLSVCDSGPALPPEARARLLERDGARGPRALGLYFCRLAADAHGGRLTVGERPGLPTVFTLELPRA